MFSTSSSGVPAGTCVVMVTMYSMACHPPVTGAVVAGNTCRAADVSRACSADYEAGCRRLFPHVDAALATTSLGSAPVLPMEPRTTPLPTARTLRFQGSATETGTPKTSGPRPPTTRRSERSDASGVSRTNVERVSPRGDPDRRLGDLVRQIGDARSERGLRLGSAAGGRREVAECPHVNRDQRQGSGGGACCASNPELSGHGESGHHVGYFVCQPQLNPSASLTSSAWLQSGEETAKAEQCVPDADGAREQDERTAGFLIAQHSSQNAPGADREGRADSDPYHGRGAN